MIQALATWDSPTAATPRVVWLKISLEAVVLSSFKLFYAIAYYDTNPVTAPFHLPFEIQVIAISKATIKIMLEGEMMPWYSLKF